MTSLLVSKNFALALLFHLLGVANCAFDFSTKEARRVDLNKCRVSECGKTGSSLSTRIIGGVPAREGQFPYQVVFTKKVLHGNFVFCGGSLINDRWILTAAHCMQGENKNAISASVGILNISEITTNAIPIEDYWIHPSYQDKLNLHDVALVKTAQSVRASSKHSVEPICLPFSDIANPVSKFATISGFGTQKEEEDTSSKLMATSVNILPDIRCLRIYGRTYKSPFMVCAGHLPGGRDTCQGDSGGPLAVKNRKGSYFLKGITAFGYGCGRRNIPGVYTKVTSHLEWICEKMVEQGLN